MFEAWVRPVRVLFFVTILLALFLVYHYLGGDTTPVVIRLP
jgi:hypothetical protein